MTKAMMTNQPTTANRQQATEADTIDDRWKLSKQNVGSADQSPFSPRRAVPKSLDRTTRRPYPSPSGGTTLNTDKETSLTKNPPTRASMTITPGASNENQKDSWKNTALAELSQRLRRSTQSKSSTADPLTPVNKFLNKEDSPASASHSDPAKPRTAAVQNRSYQLRSSEQNIPLETSTLANPDETASPAAIMFTSAGSIEHGKPPKTPRATRPTTATNSRSDAVAPVRQMSSRAGDSEAMSIPAATFAIKAGPQTAMSQWIASLNDEISDDQHSGKWEDAQDKLQSTTHEPTQYHPAVSTPPPMSIIPPNVMLNSNSSGLGPVPTRPTTTNSPETQAKGPSPPPIHSTEALPFENYRGQNNSHHAGANRPSDGEDEEENDDDEEINGPDKRRLNVTVPSSRPSNVSATLMMMSPAGHERETAGRKVTSASSSSSSSSVRMAERQRAYLQQRRYNFVPAPFNGNRLGGAQTSMFSSPSECDSLVHAVRCHPPPRHHHQCC